MPSDRVQRRIDALLDEADQAISAQDWNRVDGAARAVLAIEPANEDATAFRQMAIANGVAERAAAPALPNAGSVSVTTEKLSRSVIEAAAIVDRLQAAGSSETDPESFVGGRYRVLRFLGEGGKKRVFLAHDALLDRDVAFALIKTVGLDSVGRERITREAQAMGRLTHPQIVSIFDIGEHTAADGSKQPYLVQELMGGGDVEGLLEAADGPLSLEQSLEIAIATCRGLEFAHAQGVVHRDLKPGNVWLSADGSAKIGDFGLAISLAKSRLTGHGMMVGTVAYMPPEQALGGEVTPQADLYSLGAMLYELITGEPPFAADNPTAIISQHLNTPPVSPSYRSDRCPPELEDLILQLLEKDPTKRPDSATEVLRALERVDPAVPSRRHSGSDTNPLDRLARGVFVGRTAELERLREAFDEAFAGRGKLTMLVGEPGIGKTRTTQELETYARMRGATVVWGRARESAGAPPYWPWVQAGRAFSASLDEQTLRGLLRPDSLDLLRLFPELLTVAPDLPEPDTAADEGAQFRLFDSVTSFFARASERGPLVIMLDDLQWADKSSLLMLQHAAIELTRSRVLLVGTYRDTDLTRQSPLSDTLAQLNREPGFERVVLRGLSQPEVAHYIREVGGLEPAPEVLARIFEGTEGNPFFLQEVVNLMAQERTLEKQSLSDIAIPEGVRQALGRRLEGLSEEANELLTVASVVGREFTYDTINLLGERSDDELLRLLEEVLQARVVEELPEPGRYRFTHALMQETLLDELSTTRRVLLHGQVGEALERHWGELAEERAPRLAAHFLESATLHGEHAERAVRYARLAAEQAKAQFAWQEASRLLESALRVQELVDPTDGAARCDLLMNLADALLCADAPSRVESEIAEEAFRLAEGLGDSIRAARACVLGLNALASMGSAPSVQSKRGQEWIMRTEQHGADYGPARVFCEASRAVARGRGSESAGLLKQALADARELDDPTPFYFAAWGSIQTRALNDEEEQELARQLLLRSETDGHVGWHACGLSTYGDSRVRQQDRDGADAVYRRVIAQSERASTALSVAHARIVETGLLAMDGRLEEAVAVVTGERGETGAAQLRASATYPLFMLGRVEDYLAMSPPKGPGLVYPYALAGRSEEARSLLQAAEVSSLRLSLVLRVLDGALLLEDHAAVRALTERAVAIWEPVVPGMLATLTDRHLGDAYAFLDEPQQARERYEAAIGVAQGMRWRPEGALARYGLARLLLDHYPAELAAAADHLDFAINEFQAMGMQPALEEALQHKEILKA